MPVDAAAVADLANPMAPRPARALARRQETADTVTLHVRPLGEPLVSAPGQITMLSVFGIGEVPISISGDPDDNSEFVVTIRDVGAVTHALTGLASGDLLGARGPYGRGWPLDAAEGGDVVIVAGGIGMAPLRPALYHVLNRRDRFGGLWLAYGARSPADIVFRDQLHEWRGRFDMEVDVTVDRADPAWLGPVGVVTKLIPRQAFDPARTTAFVCGPEIMMTFTARALVDAGVPPERVFLTMERNMKCSIGFCGHCQFGRFFVCRDGPVFPYADVVDLMRIREV